MIELIKEIKDDNDLLIKLPESFKNKKIRMIIVEDGEWDYWTDEEIENFGKTVIGLSKYDFDDEEEDYSKW